MPEKVIRKPFIAHIDLEPVLKRQGDSTALSCEDFFGSGFKGFLKGFAFHLWPVVNSNHWAYWLDTVKRSIGSLINTPINLHHLDSVIIGTIVDAYFDENAGLESGAPVNIDGVLWKDLSSTSGFISKIIRSIQRGEKKFKFSVETLYWDYEFFVYDAASKPILVPNENWELYHDMAGMIITEGEYAGKTLGVLLGGRNGSLEFRGVGVTIEDLTGAADQDALILAAATDKTKEENSSGIVLADNAANKIIINSTDSTLSTKVKESLMDRQEKITKVAVGTVTTNTTEVVTPTEPVTEAALSVRAMPVAPKTAEATEVSTEVTKVEKPATVTFESLSAKIDTVAEKLSEFVASLTAPVTPTEVAEATSGDAVLHAALASTKEELVEYRMDKLTSLFGPKYLENAEYKKRLVEICLSKSREEFTAYCTDLEIARGAAPAIATSTQQTIKLVAPEKPVAIAAKNFAANGFDFSTLRITVPDPKKVSSEEEN